MNNAKRVSVRYGTVMQMRGRKRHGLAVFHDGMVWRVSDGSEVRR